MEENKVEEVSTTEQPVVDDNAVEKTEQETLPTDAKEVEWTTDFTVDNDKVVPTEQDVKAILPTKNLEKQVLKDVTARVEEQKSSKSRVFTAVFMALNIFILGLVLYYLSQKMGVSNLGEMFSNVKTGSMFWWAIGLCILGLLVESARTLLLMFRSAKCFRPALAYKSTAIEKFYDSVTPFSIGGQPFQIAYLHSRGIKAGIATSIPVSKTMINQLAFVIISLVVLLFNLSTINSASVPVVTVAIISLVAITLLVAGLFILTVSKRVAPRLLLGTLKLLNKMHIIKDYQATFTKLMKVVLEYQKSMLYYAKSPITMILLIVLSVAHWMIKASIPYFIYLAFTTTPTVGYSVIFANYILCELITKIIPLPGGIGVAEISFSALFAGLFQDGTLFWAVLLWRLLSFYVYLIQGGLVIAYDVVVGNKKNKRLQDNLKKVRTQNK